MHKHSKYGTDGSKLTMHFSHECLAFEGNLSLTSSGLTLPVILGLFGSISRAAGAISPE